MLFHHKASIDGALTIQTLFESEATQECEATRKQIIIIPQRT